MFCYCLIVVCVIISDIAEAHHRFTKPEHVRTENGWVAGERRDNYYAYEGMRYAAPPLGTHRFQPPQPYTEHWKGVRNATTFGPACLQFDPSVPGPDKMVGDEDCLFVNVYRPVKKPQPGYKFPVIVNIHGGGFRFGDGSFYGHEFIMQRGNFVFVSFNFRIGIFGFLSTKSPVVPGNMGLKDQVMVLKWVQRNIHAFDGDVNSVTLTGFASGAASVHLHYMSPLSVGLFHRGASHSGTALTPWILQTNPLEKTQVLAERVGCPTNDQQKMVNCLRQKPAADLLRTVATLGENIGPLFSFPFIPYAAVVEDENDEAFITMTPREYLEQGKIQKLPWLTSAVRDPAAFVTADLYSNETIAKINSDWNRYSSLLVDINSRDTETGSEVSGCLKQCFFGCKQLSTENFSQLTKVLSQRIFHCAMEEAIRLQGSLTPVYTYMFDFKLQLGFGQYLTKSDVNLGVGLGEDVLLLFSTPVHAPPFEYTEEEKLMTKKLLEMYATFADTGVPDFNNNCLTRSKKSVRYTVIEGPETVRRCVKESLCDPSWQQVADDLGDVV